MAFTTLKPTGDQLNAIDAVRTAAEEFCGTLDAYLPEGPDKTYVVRQFRSVVMWANVAIVRNTDGSPRE
jgi:hypothetical protein